MKTSKYIASLKDTLSIYQRFNFIFMAISDHKRTRYIFLTFLNLSISIYFTFLVFFIILIKYIYFIKSNKKMNAK